MRAFEALNNLDTFCDEKFEDDSPSFGKLKTALPEVRQTVHTLLEKKREKEPDPVEPEPVAQTAVEAAEDSTETGGSAMALSSTEPADRRQAMSAIAGAAAFLRKNEPLSPCSILDAARAALGRVAHGIATGRQPLCWKRRPPNFASRSSGWP